MLHFYTPLKRQKMRGLKHYKNKTMTGNGFVLSNALFSAKGNLLQALSSKNSLITLELLKK